VGSEMCIRDRTKAECAKSFEVDLFEAYPRVGARRRWWPKGRPVASCALTRRIHSYRVKGSSDREIPVLLAKEAENDLRRQGKSDGEISSALPKIREANLTLHEVYWLPIQHAQVCRNKKCVRVVACDLKARGRTVRHIVKLLRKSSRDIEQTLSAWTRVNAGLCARSPHGNRCRPASWQESSTGSGDGSGGSYGAQVAVLHDLHVRPRRRAGTRAGGGRCQ